MLAFHLCVLLLIVRCVHLPATLPRSLYSGLFFPTRRGALYDSMFQYAGLLWVSIS